MGENPSSGTSRKSVLIVGNHLSGAGLSRAVGEDLAEHLSLLGWSVLATSRRRGRVTRLLDMVSTAVRCREQYAVAHVDVFSGPAFFWAEAVSEVLHWMRKPYVLTLHGGNLPVFAALWPRRVSRLLSSARKVTVPSKFLQEKMRPYRQDLVLLPNAIDLSKYQYRVRSHPRPHLVWLRAFRAIYDPSLAVHVLADLHLDFPGAQLTMIGPDMGDGSLELTRDVAHNLGVSNCVRIVGPVAKKDVPTWLDAGDIFLNTTGIDNTPVSVIEAMASGMCVVSTNVGGLRYLLTHEHDSVLVPPANATAMSDAIRRLLHDRTLSERVSAAGRSTVSMLDWSLVLPRWESLLMEAMAGESCGC